MKNLLFVFHILLIFSIVGCAAKPKGVYVGEKKDGERHGQGTVTYADGTTYVGQFENGRKHGEGTHTFFDGSKYVGEFKIGKMEGLGIKTNRDGSKFDGEWKRNNPYNGKGVYQEKYGKSIIRADGEWISGKMEGNGKWSIDGNEIWFRSYEGEFQKNKFHGQGKMIASKTMTNDMGRNTTIAKLKGLTLIGEFKNGSPWNVKSFNDSGEQQTLIFLDGQIGGI